VGTLRFSPKLLFCLLVVGKCGVFEKEMGTRRGKETIQKGKQIRNCDKLWGRKVGAKTTPRTSKLNSLREGREGKTKERSCSSGKKKVAVNE